MATAFPISPNISPCKNNYPLSLLILITKRFIKYYKLF
jgi:hypothetical protein